MRSERLERLGDVRRAFERSAKALADLAEHLGTLETLLEVGEASPEVSQAQVEKAWDQADEMVLAAGGSLAPDFVQSLN